MKVKDIKTLGERISPNAWSTPGETGNILAASMAEVAELRTVYSRVQHERDALAKAISDAALKGGIWNGKVPLAGPHLIMFANDLAGCALAAQSATGMVQAAWIDFSVAMPAEGQYVVVCGAMPPDIKSDCKGWRTCARYVDGNILDGNGCTRNSATHWMPMAESVADGGSIHPPADAAPVDAKPVELEQLHTAAAQHKMALVPLHLTRAMLEVLADEWEWEDLLAAAEAITDEQYAEVCAGPSAAQRRVEELEYLLEAAQPATAQGEALSQEAGRLLTQAIPFRLDQIEKHGVAGNVAAIRQACASIERELCALTQRAASQPDSERDAARYRFVRAGFCVKDAMNRWMPRKSTRLPDGSVMWSGVYTEAEYDDAVDRDIAAMAAQQGEKGIA